MRPRSIRSRRVWAAAAILVTVAILVGCLVPGETIDVNAPSWTDKAAHAIGFLAFGFAWRRAGVPLAAVLLFGALLAAGTETLQAFLPIGRHGDLLDAAFDLAGLVVGGFVRRQPPIETS